MQQTFIIQSWNVWPPIAVDDEKLALLQKTILTSVPKMLKRRLSPLAKTVFCAALSCEKEVSALPIVFSSTHGELAKSLKMMKTIEAGEEISPTSFSLSVHNAIAGLFSIAFDNKIQATVLAAGEEGMATAFIEAAGLFHEGESEVLVVFYDEPLPDFFPSAPYQVTAKTCAVALKLIQEGAGQKVTFEKGSISGDEGEQPLQLPKLIDFLTCQIQQKLQIITPRHSWHWEKH